MNMKEIADALRKAADTEIAIGKTALQSGDSMLWEECRLEAKYLSNLATKVEQMRCETWQPIDTAPNDGTSILALCGDVITTVYFDTSSGWELCDPGAWAEHTDRVPTHWMPLPETPQGAYNPPI